MTVRCLAQPRGLAGRKAALLPRCQPWSPRGRAVIKQSTTAPRRFRPGARGGRGKGRGRGPERDGRGGVGRPVIHRPYRATCNRAGLGRACRGRGITSLLGEEWSGENRTAAIAQPCAAKPRDDEPCAAGGARWSMASLWPPALHRHRAAAHTQTQCSGAALQFHLNGELRHAPVSSLGCHRATPRPDWASFPR